MCSESGVVRTVLAFGEVLWDLLPDGPVLGGAPGNFAYRANSLGDRAFIVSRLGRDSLGDRAWDRLGELGLDRRFVQRHASRPTGTVSVFVDARGNPDFTIHTSVAYDAIEATEELLSFAPSADCLCFGTLIQRTPGSRETLHRLLEAIPSFDGDKGCLRLLDINLRKECFSPETVRFSLGHADVLKLNDHEAKELAAMLDLPMRSLPDLCDRFLEGWGLKCCVVTLGERGAYAAAAGGEKVHVPGHRVKVVDTCGSGDAFTAGFIHELLRHRPLADCCALGNALGALVASQAGGTAPVSREDLTRLGRGGEDRIADPALERHRTA